MPDTIERRHFLQGAGVLTGAVLAASSTVGAREALAQAAPPAGKAVTYDIKPLPFDPSKIKGLSEKLLVSHHENNYSGAVKRLNAITAQLAALDWASAPVFPIN